MNYRGGYARGGTRSVARRRWRQLQPGSGTRVANKSPNFKVVELEKQFFVWVFIYVQVSSFSHRHTGVGSRHGTALQQKKGIYTLLVGVGEKKMGEEARER